ncbi:hypothetical protein D9V29_00950 [Mycetocola manganoxydans]|uniref:Uncharacterized protein n=1 Tax=Mycetocola manganoxydans TaxID=699879 RepID=A0A3L7A1E2_9MICO|nr:hypothetical protein [Mycetocola manganoxydans]RLP73894.1 hypothetical protein D9V29_00950 [Mycetocola manganoxydans]GHD42458.1 hypothetical protein GCM10008097_08440 [Mycetocola manganoxydans]
MIALNRYTMLALAAAFSFYHVVRGLLTLPQADSPWPSVMAMALYLTATGMALWPSSPTAMPAWLASFCLATAISVPLLVTSQLDPAVNNGYATWHVSAIGTLMTITVVRRQEIVGWLGVLFLTVQSVIWCGIPTSMEIGVTGSLMWVVVAGVLTRSLAKVGHDAQTLTVAEQEAAKWQAAQDAHEQERRARLEQTGKRALPILRDIILAGGELSEAQRIESRVLEAGLRDEIRGRRLLNDAVRTSVLAARRRGTTVSMLDEGTLDHLPEDALQSVLDEVAVVIADTHVDRLIVRTAPADSDVAVTLVGLSASTDPDEPGDSVRLWKEIPRPAVQAPAARPGRESWQAER